MSEKAWRIAINKTFGSYTLKAIMLHISHNCDDNFIIETSHHKIASHIESTKRTVDIAIKKLIKENVLILIDSCRHDNKIKKFTYYLNLRDNHKIPEIIKKYKHLYIIEASGFYKIGVSYKVHKRMSSIQTSNPVKIKLIKKYKYIDTDCDNIEKMVHKTLVNYRSTGGSEWFKCDLEKIKKNYKKV